LAFHIIFPSASDSNTTVLAVFKQVPFDDSLLIGKGRVLISTGTGYQELDIHSGKMMKEVSVIEVYETDLREAFISKQKFSVPPVVLCYNKRT